MNESAKPLRQVYFVTGTDTEVGKTLVSCVLLARAKRLGRSAFGIKPITAGTETDESGRQISGDAERMNRFATVVVDPLLRAPVRLPLPMSPHLAAEAAGVRLQAERVIGQVRAGVSTRADVVIVEGAGGWRVPINARETMADIARLLQKPVILVVRIRLGCLNHALLSAEAIQHDGLILAGWVATVLDDEQSQEVIDAQCRSLKARLRAPLLGVIPYQPGLRNALIWNEASDSMLMRLAEHMRLPDEATSDDTVS